KGSKLAARASARANGKDVLGFKLRRDGRGTYASVRTPPFGLRRGIASSFSASNGLPIRISTVARSLFRSSPQQDRTEPWMNQTRGLEQPAVAALKVNRNHRDTRRSSSRQRQHTCTRAGTL